MVLDQLKGFSDDFSYTEEHIISLVNHYRAFLLKQRYASDAKKQVPDSNYQEICLNLSLQESDSSCSTPMLKSIEQIPDTLLIGNPIVSTINYYKGINISYVSRERMRYVGNNKYLANIIYSSKGPDNHLYLTSQNPQFKYLEKIKFSGVFDDIEQVFKLACNNNSETICDILDMDFPLESALINPLIELVVKELNASVYRPEDSANNSADDLSKVNVSNERR